MAIGKLNSAIGLGRGGLNYQDSRDKGLNKKQSAAVGAAAGVPTVAGFAAGDAVRKQGFHELKAKHHAALKTGGHLSLTDRAVAGHLGKRWGLELGGLAAGGVAAKHIQAHFQRKSSHEGVNTKQDQHWNNTTSNF